MSILLVAPHDDREALRVDEVLDGMGESIVWCDPASFPEHTLVSVKNGRLRLGGGSLATPHAAYIRSLTPQPLAPKFREELQDRPEALIARCDEIRALFESFLQVLERKGARLVNSLKANLQHGQKPFQLEVLQSRDVPIPKWLATNDPQAVRRFAEQVDRVIFKPLTGGPAGRLLDQGELAELRLEALGMAPALFQEYFEGTVIRVYVAGKSAIAAAEVSPPGEDSRENEHIFDPIRLKSAEKRAAEAAARACHMHFSGVDLVRFSGGFRVLNCDPAPAFVPFEEQTGLDIASTLAQLLVYTGASAR